MSADLKTQLVLAAIALLNALTLALTRWKAKQDFDIARGQNQALEDIKAARGVETLAPPARRRRKRRSLLLPRAPTPLPFFPVKEAAPERSGTEQTEKHKKGD